MADIDGTPEADTIPGTGEADDINGLGSGDSIHGNGGDDDIQGEAGNDILFGDDGNDTLVDDYNGSQSNPDNDTMFGGAGDDVLISYQAGHFIDQDEMRGGAGNDILVLNGGQTGDLADGGPGIDRFSGDFSSGATIVLVFSSVGFSIQVNGINNATVQNCETLGFLTGYGNDFVTGGNLNDNISSLGGADTLSGGAGDDTIGMITQLAFNTALSLDGGAGIDTLSLFTADGMNFLLDFGGDTYTQNGTAFGGFTNFEAIDVFAGDGNDTIIGGARADNLRGNEGNDSIEGGNGNDTIRATDGADTANGGGGDDSISGGFSDFFDPDANWNKKLSGGGGDDTVAGAGKGSTVDGGAGTDTLWLDNDSFNWTIRVEDDGKVHFRAFGSDVIVSGFEFFRFDDGTFTTAELGVPKIINGNAAANTLNGTAGINYISAGNGNDTADGKGGNDTVLGGGGNDLLNGGAGDDVLEGGPGTDTLKGGTGIDTADLGTVNVPVGWIFTLSPSGAEQAIPTGDSIQGIEALIATLGNGADRVTGGIGADSLTASGGNDTLKGGDGEDTLDGGNGVDTLDFSTDAAAVTVFLTGFVQDGSGNFDSISNFENVIGSAFADNLSGTIAANRLEGRNGNDTLGGSAGDDVLLGGTGADSITGGAGADNLTGGADADRYVYTSATDSTVDLAGRDEIFGFEADATDLIVLTAIDAIDGGTDDAFTFRGGLAFNGLGQVRVRTQGGDTLIDLNISGNNDPDMRIVINGIVSLDAADFLL